MAATQFIDLAELAGRIPDGAFLALPPGCNFNPRCPHRRERCVREVPPTEEVAENHTAACFFWKEVARG